jgi:CBS domain-containing protein
MKMKERAKDLMRRDFHTLQGDMSISAAMQVFISAGAKEGRKIFGMMVTDKDDRLAGVLSMYDILLFIRPKHVHLWGLMEDLDIAGMMASSCTQARDVRVADIMTSEVISVTPDTHLLLVLDIMIKNHVRRIPVLSDERIQGIIYISDLFHHIADQLRAET